MAMQLTVSRNRKTSHNYNSEGFGVTVTVELDQALLNRPADLQKQIDNLYREADEALERQASGNAQHTAHTRHTPHGGQGNGNARATESQMKAIHAIGRRLGLDVAAECRDELGVNLDDLDVPTASRLIDHLKAIQPSGNGQGRGRGNGNGARR
jgi:hypothetical protein